MKYFILLILTLNLHAQDLYIFAGQSNMQGYALIEELTMSDLDNEGIYGWDWKEKRFIHNPSPGDNQNVFHAELIDGHKIHDLRDNFGCELSALRVIRDITQKPVFFIKYSVGGSGLNEWIYTYTPKVQQEITRTGKTAAAWFWMQGETDASYYYSSISYQSRLSSMIDDIGVRFIACQISRRWPYAAFVRKALYELNRSMKLSLIGSDALPVFRGEDSHFDGLNTAHYNTEGIRKMGIKFALSYLYYKNTNAYPEILCKLNKDDHIDFLEVQPVNEIKYFKAVTMESFSIKSRLVLQWQGKDFDHLHESFDFIRSADADNDGDSDISHTANNKDIYIWRIELPHIISSVWN